MLRRVAPAVGLFFLAPLVAEYLLGNIPPSELAGVLILAPMYGGGALLIREVARRAGRGWPTILVLGAAYGLLEAGLLDQSLFNPSFDEGYDFQSVAHVPVLGISAHYALTFVVGHAVWSIGVPVLLVESIVPARRTRPWLGVPGLAVTGVLFVVGSAVIAADHRTTFVAAVPQVAGASAVIVALIGVAFAAGRRSAPPAHPSSPGAGSRTDSGVNSGTDSGVGSGEDSGVGSGVGLGAGSGGGVRRAPGPWLVGPAAFVTASVFAARPESWWGVVIGAGLIALTAVVVARWSGRAGWGDAHRLALGGGALLTYAWLGFLLLYFEGNAGTANLLAQVALVLGALALLLLAARRVAAARLTAPARTPPESPSLR
ncbi:hypothetical protein [Sphaerisporangium dianthi]|uniref:DUF998 domain-containing protein n=1 Tax=Sphaerisporangium dianthi TaxID=1436120 RepID=A0ABV9CND8_9ACTN